MDNVNLAHARRLVVRNILRTPVHIAGDRNEVIGASGPTSSYRTVGDDTPTFTVFKHRSTTAPIPIAHTFTEIFKHLSFYMQKLNFIDNVCKSETVILSLNASRLSIDQSMCAVHISVS